MREIFSQDNIILDASFADKWSAIEACGSILVEGGYAMPQYVEDMKERERQISVYIGNGVAIPHGLSGSEESIIESGLSFIQIPGGVDFDGQTCTLMIGIAGKGDDHIEMLGKIANVCMDQDNIKALTTAQDRGRIMEILDL